MKFNKLNQVIEYYYRLPCLFRLLGNLARLIATTFYMSRKLSRLDGRALKSGMISSVSHRDD